MRKWAIILGVTLVVTSGYALPKELTLEQLKARVQNAKPDERANLCAQIAEREVEVADKLYTDGKVEEAETAIRDVVSYSQQASDAAGQTGHHLKNMEIGMRKMGHRLTDIKRGLPFENQATVQAAVDTLERIRTDLLNRMFGKNPK
jgi:polyhydroxyalkanoate synthesis regulator phasin